ncbi:hypothetical protein C8R44DRAFT_893879 [Mycena epipterygia]|nr:hypothetical protein C8R44DRAFT_893879 [Mycena epipterygia]
MPNKQAVSSPLSLLPSSPLPSRHPSSTPAPRITYQHLPAVGDAYAPAVEELGRAALALTPGIRRVVPPCWNRIPAGMPPSKRAQQSRHSAQGTPAVAATAPSTSAAAATPSKLPHFLPSPAQRDRSKSLSAAYSSAASTSTSSSSGGGRRFLVLGKDTREREQQHIRDAKRTAASAAELLILHKSGHNTDDLWSPAGPPSVYKCRCVHAQRGAFPSPSPRPPPSSSGHVLYWLDGEAAPDAGAGGLAPGCVAWPEDEQCVTQTQCPHRHSTSTSLSHAINANANDKFDAAAWHACFHAHFSAQVWYTYRVGFEAIRDLPSLAPVFADALA